MMTEDQIEALAVLDKLATPGPWYVRHLDDDHCMSAIGIATSPDTGTCEGMATFDFAKPELVAATLIQAPPYVVPSDHRWQENADLIVALRNALPDLVNLARKHIARDK